MSTVPAERDLPPAARDAARAQVVAAVARPARRRWVPVAAAAAAVVAIAVPVAVVAVRHQDGGPTATPVVPAAAGTAAGRAVPDPASIVAKCTSRAARSWDLGRPGDVEKSDVLPPTVQLHALFQDTRGYVALMGGPRYVTYCAYRWDGGVDDERGMVTGDVIPYGYSTLSVPQHIEVFDSFLKPLPGGKASALLIHGTVQADVARVVLRWDGYPPVQADVRGPYYLARILAPATAAGHRYLAELDTYREDGSRIGTTQVSG